MTDEKYGVITGQPLLAAAMYFLNLIISQVKGFHVFALLCLSMFQYTVSHFSKLSIHLYVQRIIIGDTAILITEEKGEFTAEEKRHCKESHIHQ